MLTACLCLQGSQEWGLWCDDSASECLTAICPMSLLLVSLFHTISGYAKSLIYFQMGLKMA